MIVVFACPTASSKVFRPIRFILESYCWNCAHSIAFFGLHFSDDSLLIAIVELYLYIYRKYRIASNAASTPSILPDYTTAEKTAYSGNPQKEY